MNRRERKSILLLVWLAVLAFALFSLFFVQYTRDVVYVNVQGDKLNVSQFGFQRTSLINGFFNEIPKGDLRLYIGVRSENLNEFVYTGAINDLGNGVFYFTDLKFPVYSDTWEVRFDLKDTNNTVLDQKCYKVKFISQNNARSIQQNAC